MLHMHVNTFHLIEGREHNFHTVVGSDILQIVCRLLNIRQYGELILRVFLFAFVPAGECIAPINIIWDLPVWCHTLQ